MSILNGVRVINQTAALLPANAKTYVPSYKIDDGGVNRVVAGIKNASDSIQIEGFFTPELDNPIQLTSITSGTSFVYPINFPLCGIRVSKTGSAGLAVVDLLY